MNSDSSLSERVKLHNTFKYQVYNNPKISFKKGIKEIFELLFVLLLPERNLLERKRKVGSAQDFAFELMYGEKTARKEAKPTQQNTIPLRAQADPWWVISLFYIKYLLCKYYNYPHNENLDLFRPVFKLFINIRYIHGRPSNFVDLTTGSRYFFKDLHE